MAATSVSTTRNSVDPFAVEVIRQGLASIAEEMTLIVMRAARSPALREAGDLSSALTDAQGGIIAQGRDLPAHLGVMAFTMQSLIERAGVGAFEDGDVWIVNQPDVGGNHLPDVKLARPIFSGNRLVAFAVSLAHWADVGGGAPGSYNAGARDLWQEGLQIPPVRIIRAEKPVPDVLAMIRANVRGSEERAGDLLAQAAALRAADARVKDLIRRMGLSTYLASLQEIHRISERQIRRVISSIPDGTYSGEDFLDGDGHGGEPIRIAVEVRVAGDEARFDFSNSADAIPAPLNTTPFVTYSSTLFVLKSLVEEEAFHSNGAFRPFKVVTRKGSLLDPMPGYPVVAGNHETSQRVADAVIRALSHAIPDRLPAGGCGSAGLLIFAGRDDRGRHWTFYETHGGGEGAHRDRDGYSATRVNLANMANTPAEFIESEYPIRVLQAAVRDGSGGDGRHRGGDGLVREYQILDNDVTLTTVFERSVVPPYGLDGGKPGKPFRVTLKRGDERITLSNCGNYQLKARDILLVETAGGGGFGVANR